METQGNFGKYQVKETIGKGAMGVVYLGFDTALERPVAIKTISSTMSDQELKTRFIREARSTAKLHHNNIVTIYDFGLEGEQLYIVMEYLEGLDLDTLIKEKPRMDIKDRLEIILQICSGLDYAHQKGIFHRDVKPANIKFSKEGDVKIVDFGLAAAHSSTITKSDAVLGTPHFIAPERLKGEKADGRTDQFSVGLILYELLTYTRPFTGDSISSIIYNILNKEPQRLDPRIIDKFPELEFIIRKSIAKSREYRYNSMKDMAADIQSLQQRMRESDFSMDGPIAVQDEPMPGLITGDDTLLSIPGQKSAAIPAKRKLRHLQPAIWGVVAVILLAIVLLYFLVLVKKPPITGSGIENPGFLAFDVKPYAVIEKVVNIDNQEIILSTGDERSRTTPLRLRLAPGRYRIVYSHPQWGEESRSKTVTITAGQTVYEKDWHDPRFIQEAISHFSISQ